MTYHAPGVGPYRKPGASEDETREVFNLMYSVVFNFN